MPEPSETNVHDDLAQRFIHVIEQSFRRYVDHHALPAPGFNPSLTVNQVRALHCLRQQSGMTQKELSERLGVTPPATSSIVRELAQLGLLDRQIDLQDARVMRLHLSPNAQQTLESVWAGRKAAARELLGALPLEDQRLVVELLEQALTRQEMTG